MIEETRLAAVEEYIKGIKHPDCPYLAAYICLKCGWIDPDAPRIHHGEYIAHIREMAPKWISVEDDLPKDGRRCRIYFGKDDTALAWRENGRWVDDEGDFGGDSMGRE